MDGSLSLEPPVETGGEGWSAGSRPNQTRLGENVLDNLAIALALLLPLAGGFLFSVLMFHFCRRGKREAWLRAGREFPICPKCGYAMKGLTVARCPECGTEYTLDSLWLAQRDVE